MDSRYLRTVLPILLIACSLLTPGVVSAVELDGQFSSEWYTYSQDDQNHLRPYQRLQTDLTAYRSESGKTIRWHTNARWSTDLINKQTGDPELSVYQSYIHYNGLPANAGVSLGRQFVYNGLSSAFIDGVRFSGIQTGPVRSDLYFGSSVDRLDPQHIRSFSDWLEAGMQVDYKYNRRTNFAASMSLRKDNGDLESHRIGITARHRARLWQCYTLAAYDPRDKNLSDLVGRVSVPVKLWHFTAEYANRMPQVRRNSLFSMLESDRYQNVRLSATRTIRDDWRLVSTINSSVGRDENVLRTSLGLKSNRYHLIWTHQTGQGSVNDGIRVGINRQFFDIYRVFAQAGYNSYLIQELQVDRLSAWYLRAGFSRDIGHGLEFEAEGQIIRNAVSNYDNRVLVRLSKAFSLGAIDE